MSGDKNTLLCFSIPKENTRLDSFKNLSMQLFLSSFKYFYLCKKILWLYTVWGDLYNS